MARSFKKKSFVGNCAPTAAKVVTLKGNTISQSGIPTHEHRFIGKQIDMKR